MLQVNYRPGTGHRFNGWPPLCWASSRNNEFGFCFNISRKVRTEKQIRTLACDTDRLRLEFCPVRFVSEDATAWLRAVIEEHELSLVVVDDPGPLLPNQGSTEDFAAVFPILPAVDELPTRRTRQLSLRTPSDTNQLTALNDRRCHSWIRSTGPTIRVLGRRSPYQHNKRHELWSKIRKPNGNSGLLRTNLNEQSRPMSKLRTWDVTYQSSLISRQ